MAGRGSFGRGVVCNVMCWDTSVESSQAIRWTGSIKQFLGMLRVGVWLLANGACGISDAAHIQLAGRDAGVAAKERAAPLGDGPATGLWGIHHDSIAQATRNK